jgi:hypothetical protein
MRSYRGELFDDDDGRPVPELDGAAPTGDEHHPHAKRG